MMLSVAARFPAYQAVIAGAPGIHPSLYEEVIARYKTDATIVFDSTFPLLQHSAAALVTSGTATLETALFGVPQVVCYQFFGGYLANFIFNRFFHVPYISLVNLIANRQVVQELFGGKITPAQIHQELQRIIEEPKYRPHMCRRYAENWTRLGEHGASVPSS